MSEQRELICWNCSKRTTSGTCIHCGAQVSDPKDVFVEKEKKKEDEDARRRMFEIRSGDEVIAEIDFKDILTIISDNYEGIKIAGGSPPRFIVDMPAEDEFNEKFEILISASEEIEKGLYPTIKANSNNPEEAIISFIYVRQQDFPTFWFSSFLLLFVFVSTLIAGLYNYSNLQSALGQLDSMEGFTILETVINTDSIIAALKFTGVILGIFVIKDFPYLLDSLKNNKPDFLTFYIPTPPIFELGSLGSLLHQLDIHKDRKSLFFRTYLSTLVAWIVSVGVILYSLDNATLDPESAGKYSSTSIAANGQYEPVILRGLAFISNYLGMTDINTSAPITVNYIFTPITLAAIGALYITGINLLPTSHLNGGYGMLASFGQKAYSIAAYVVIFSFISVNWLITAFLFAIHEFLQPPQILDEYTEPPKYVKFIFVIGVILGLLSFPISLELLF